MKSEITKGILEKFSFARMVLDENAIEHDVRRNFSKIGDEPVIPWELLRDHQSRDMQATVLKGGAGSAVSTDTQPVVEALRNHSCFMRFAGDYTISGLTGNFKVPIITAPITPLMVSEIAAAQAQTMTTDAGVLHPARLTVATQFSRQLDIQAVATERIIRRHLAMSFAVALDRQLLYGAGQNNEIVGIFNRDDTNNFQWGGAATWANILAAEAAIGGLSADNPDGSGMGWIVSNQTRKVWKGAQKIAGSNFPSFLMESDQSVNGSPALVTMNLSDTNRTVLGNWAHAWPLFWGNGFDLTVDRVTLAATGLIRVTAHLWFNLFIAHGAAFAVSQDSGAQ